jgi:Ras GTPase-activating-like protein IQGAP2/3
MVCVCVCVCVCVYASCVYVRVFVYVRVRACVWLTRQRFQRPPNSSHRSTQDSIVRTMKLLPFGLRSICRDLSIALRKRFPTEPDDDILKCVGNILYYRYMNPAVIAPDGFDVVQLQHHDTLSPVTRGNLGHVAKLMQMAASGQVLGDGTSMLDQFLREAWGKFRAFFVAAINVDSLEEHFHVDEYSEVVLKSRPAIVISYHDMYFVHRMVVEQLVHLAPKDTDPLRLIVADLGAIGEPAIELGEEGASCARV